MNKNAKIVDSMLELIGEIPLVRLNRIGDAEGAEILVKPEFLNPSGSIKDRIAKMMIEEAEKSGKLKKGMTIVEATTGNTGTALAFVSAVKGYRFVAYTPTMVANKSRMGIMLAYGCETEAIDIEAYNRKMNVKGGDDSSVHGGHVELMPRQMCFDLEKESDDIWWARQFSSAENVGAHREGTAREILEQTDGKLDAFVGSVGTGGTILGAAQALKAQTRIF